MLQGLLPILLVLTLLLMLNAVIQRKK